MTQPLRHPAAPFLQIASRPLHSSSQGFEDLQKTVDEKHGTAGISIRHLLSFSHELPLLIGSFARNVLQIMPQKQTDDLDIMAFGSTAYRWADLENDLFVHCLDKEKLKEHITSLRSCCEHAINWKFILHLTLASQKSMDSADIPQKMSAIYKEYFSRSGIYFARSEYSTQLFSDRICQFILTIGRWKVDYSIRESLNQFGFGLDNIHATAVMWHDGQFFPAWHPLYFPQESLSTADQRNLLKQRHLLLAPPEQVHPEIKAQHPKLVFHWISALRQGWALHEPCEVLLSIYFHLYRYSKGENAPQEHLLKYLDLHLEPGDYPILCLGLFWLKRRPKETLAEVKKIQEHFASCTWENLDCFYDAHLIEALFARQMQWPCEWHRHLAEWLSYEKWETLLTKCDRYAVLRDLLSIEKSDLCAVEGISEEEWLTFMKQEVSPHPKLFEVARNFLIKRWSDEVKRPHWQAHVHYHLIAAPPHILATTLSTLVSLQPKALTGTIQCALQSLYDVAATSSLSKNALAALFCLSRPCPTVRQKSLVLCTFTPNHLWHFWSYLLADASLQDLALCALESLQPEPGIQINHLTTLLSCKKQAPRAAKLIACVLQNDPPSQLSLLEYARARRHWSDELRYSHAFYDHIKVPGPTAYREVFDVLSSVWDSSTPIPSLIVKWVYHWVQTHGLPSLKGICKTTPKEYVPLITLVIKECVDLCNRTNYLELLYQPYAELNASWQGELTILFNEACTAVLQNSAENDSIEQHARLCRRLLEKLDPPPAEEKKRALQLCFLTLQSGQPAPQDLGLVADLDIMTPSHQELLFKFYLLCQTEDCPLPPNLKEKIEALLRLPCKDLLTLSKNPQFMLYRSVYDPYALLGATEILAKDLKAAHVDALIKSCETWQEHLLKDQAVVNALLTLLERNFKGCVTQADALAIFFHRLILADVSYEQRLFSLRERYYKKYFSESTFERHLQFCKENAHHSNSWKWILTGLPLFNNPQWPLFVFRSALTQPSLFQKISKEPSIHNLPNHFPLLELVQQLTEHFTYQMVALLREWYKKHLHHAEQSLSVKLIESLLPGCLDYLITSKKWNEVEIILELISEGFTRISQTPTSLSESQWKELFACAYIYIEKCIDQGFVNEPDLYTASRQDAIFQKRLHAVAQLVHAMLALPIRLQILPSLFSLTQTLCTLELALFPQKISVLTPEMGAIYRTFTKFLEFDIALTMIDAVFKTHVELKGSFEKAGRFHRLLLGELLTKESAYAIGHYLLITCETLAKNAGVGEALKYLLGFLAASVELLPQAYSNNDDLQAAVDLFSLGVEELFETIEALLCHTPNATTVSLIQGELQRFTRTFHNNLHLIVRTCCGEWYANLYLRAIQSEKRMHYECILWHQLFLVYLGDVSETTIEALEYTIIKMLESSQPSTRKTCQNTLLKITEEGLITFSPLEDTFYHVIPEPAKFMRLFSLVQKYLPDDIRAKIAPKSTE